MASSKRQIIYFYRELSRLKKLKRDKELAIGCSEIKKDVKQPTKDNVENIDNKDKQTITKNIYKGR